MRAVILGLGASGKAAAHYLHKKGYSIVGVDRSPQALYDCIKEDDPIALDGVDLVVKSPGVSTAHPWARAAREKKIKVVGEMDLALAELKNKNKTLIAITGSNGKTTTTALTAHLLNYAGKKALAAGNIGLPLLSQIESDYEIFVIELSSFQLEDIVENRVFDAAAILNITPNHLDRHPSFEDYVRAKMRISCCLKEGAKLFVSRKSAHLCQGEYEIFDEKRVETILPLGYRDSIYPHDLENAAAALALTRLPGGLFKGGLATFTKPPHRLEFVRLLNGVRYINDSKATSVDAVIKAVESVKGPIILIAGGVDKGGDYREWLRPFKDKVKQIFALGLAAKRIEESLAQEFKVEIVPSLQEGVCRAAALSCRDDAILLSPGCSSYDHFRDYEARGEAFKQIVNAFVE